MINKKEAQISTLIFKYLEIKNLKDGKVWRRIDVSGKTDRTIEKIKIGMNVNLNLEQFYIVRCDSDVELNTI